MSHFLSNRNIAQACHRMHQLMNAGWPLEGKPGCRTSDGCGLMPPPACLEGESAVGVLVCHGCQHRPEPAKKQPGQEKANKYKNANLESTV